MIDNDGPHDYLYDQLYRLIDASHPQPQNPAENFTYDPAGNRTGSHLSNGYIVDNMNRLWEDDQNRYQYDLNGNMTSKTDQVNGSVLIYKYDAENRLTKVTNGTSLITYQYDGFGRRIAKTVNGVTARYVYDEKDVLLELDDQDRVTARYTRTLAVDELISVKRDTTGDGVLDITYYYHRDGLGSVTSMTDSAGAVVQSYIYDAFGTIKNQSGAIQNRYTYTSREWDQEAGLYYYRARYYDAEVGRFISEDPSHYPQVKGENIPYLLTGFLNNPQELNGYGYVTNNPVNMIDPVGLCGASGGGCNQFACDACNIICGITIGIGCQIFCQWVGGNWVCIPICGTISYYVCNYECGRYFCKGC